MVASLCESRAVAPPHLTFAQLLNPPRMARKRSPFNTLDAARGSVVAVEFRTGLWCYVRDYLLSHGFLPFFSRAPLSPGQLPSLRAEHHFDLWCHDTEEMPMVLIGRFPFDSPDEMHGEPYYTPPDSIDSRYRIHEATAGVSRIRTTLDAREVASLRRQRRYQPHEFSGLLADRLAVWPTI